MPPAIHTTYIIACHKPIIPCTSKSKGYTKKKEGKPNTNEEIAAVAASVADAAAMCCISKCVNYGAGSVGSVQRVALPDESTKWQKNTEQQEFALAMLLLRLPWVKSNGATRRDEDCSNSPANRMQVNQFQSKSTTSGPLVLLLPSPSCNSKQCQFLGNSKCIFLHSSNCKLSIWNPIHIADAWLLNSLSVARLDLCLTVYAGWQEVKSEGEGGRASTHGYMQIFLRFTCLEINFV